jgi:putative glycosyltransferase
MTDPNHTAQAGSAPELSVVTTLYRSAPFVAEFYHRVVETATRVARDYEIIFVNDGSPDDAVQIAVFLSESDPRVHVLDLSRNFGHHAAILAGLRHSRGAFVFLIDIDLEEQPEWLGEFWRELHSGSLDVVYGVQAERVGGAFKRHTGAAFYRIFNLLSDTTDPANACTVRLMTRRYVDAVTAFSETHLYLGGLFEWTGFAQRPIYVMRKPRNGQSTYTPIKLVRLFVNAITSFSSYPLTIVFVAGLSITGLSMAYGGYLLIAKLISPDTVLSGFTSIMLSLWFIGGALLSVLGLIGMYIGRIFVETKRRPQYVIRRIYERGAAAAEHD